MRPIDFMLDIYNTEIVGSGGSRILTLGGPNQDTLGARR